jgi:hypothetical protein
MRAQPTRCVRGRVAAKLFSRPRRSWSSAWRQRLPGYSRARWGLDCNGFSPIQHTVGRAPCTDPRGAYDGEPARFLDNGHYIGHDEPPS